MKVYSSTKFTIPLPKSHRFPIEKYRLLEDRIRKLDQITIVNAEIISQADLYLAHDKNYVESVSNGQLSKREEMALGFPWSRELIMRTFYSMGASVSAAKTALREGVSCSLAGGTHHAFYSSGNGFCVFNDAAIISKKILELNSGESVLIIDTDVHQGDGTASILKKNKNVFTFSLHSARNYPHTKQTSDLDISLPDKTSGDIYLDALKEGLKVVQGMVSPSFIIYLSGADIFEHDRLGRLKISKEEIKTRDEIVINYARKNQTPIVVLMGGGYGKKISDTVDIHVNTIMTALRAYEELKS